MSTAEQKIQKQFDKVINHSQGFAPNTDELFKQWRENKDFFIKRARGFIWETIEEVHFTLGESEKLERLDNFLDWLDREYAFYDLSSFIHDQRHGFYQNIVEEDYEYKGVKIQKGSKLLKAFKYFVNDKEVLSKVQDKASMVIQDDKIHGKLCLSVHPLDFLSSSENTYKWRSCHALDGEYRSGNLSYMADSCTIMAYLKGANGQDLPNFPNDVKWNSKKWRMLVNISSDRKAVFFGRQYPFHIEGAMEKVLLILQGLGILPDQMCTPHRDSVRTVPGEKTSHSLSCAYYPTGMKLFTLDEMVNDESDLHFNDILKSSCYIPYFSSYWYANEMPKFHVGAKVNCLKCGQEEIYGCGEDDNGSMVCESCWPELYEDRQLFYCDYCNTSGSEDEIYFLNGVAMCYSCWQERVVECEYCGDWMFRESAKVTEHGHYACSRLCATEIERIHNTRKEEENGERTNSQDQGSRETERDFWTGLPR